ncbi:MAG: hypothetical protein WA952_11190 [Lewinella sp.]
MTPTIRRLPRNHIDFTRWDQAVMTDAVPLPYGLSWWLDAATENSWEGLIVDDYRVVLPLPKLRRYGIVPTYGRPPFTQQLGPYGQLQGGDLAKLLTAVPAKMQIALPLRPTVDVDSIPDRFAYRSRVNLVLKLDATLSEIRGGYPGKLRKFLQRSKDDRLEPIAGEALVALCRERLSGRGGMRDSHWDILASIIEACQERGVGDCYQLKEDNQLLAAGFYPHLEARTINLTAVSTERGLKRRGMSRLLDLVFQQHLERPGAVFDFEGSEIPGVRAFFEKFGGVNEGYIVVEEKLYGLR